MAKHKYLDKNDYPIKDMMDIFFTRPNETVKVLGTVEDLQEDGTVTVSDEDNEMFTLPSKEIEVVMNRKCNNCGEEFNKVDAYAIIEGIGKTLNEGEECPHCHEENNNEEGFFNKESFMA